jgi:hypothetical protein
MGSSGPSVNCLLVLGDKVEQNQHTICKSFCISSTPASSCVRPIRRRVAAAGVGEGEREPGGVA